MFILCINQKKLLKKVYSTVIKSKAASKAAIQKIAEANGNLVGNKSADKITIVSKIFPQNTVESELEISKERYILPAKRLQIIHELNLLCDIIIEYQNITNLLDNTPNQSTKFRTKNWVKINDDLQGMHNTNSQIKFKTSMLK